MTIRRIAGRSSTPTTPKRNRNSAPPTIAATALMPSQSATRKFPGLPARASRFSVRSRNELLAILVIRPDSPATTGRSVRSRNGAWSSSSSRFFACIVPSCVSRACTGSAGELPARPSAIRRIAPAAAPATRRGIRSVIG
jgi:hypothetical protein